MLRGLYERVVTIVYLHKNPPKAERFYKYAVIQEHRALTHARKLFSDEDIDKAFGAPTVAPMEEKYNETKDEFKKTKCKNCGTTEVAHSWDIDLATMAEKAGEGLTKLYLQAYALPTLEFHATLTSGLSRTINGSEQILFSSTVPESETDLCVHSAFILLGLLIDVNIAMFDLPLGAELQDFWDRYNPALEAHHAIKVRLQEGNRAAGAERRR